VIPYKLAVKYFKEHNLRQFVDLSVNYFLAKILLILDRKYVSVDIFGYNLLVDVRDEGISRALIHHEIREIDQYLMIKKNMGSRPVILDIGSNIGYYLCVFNEITSGDCEIIAVEPEKNNFELLSANIILNGGLQVIEKYNMAVSDESGVFNLEISNMSNLHKLSKGFDKTRGDISTQLVDVESIEFFINSNKPDFIRMDVEGAEVQILNSLLDYLKSDDDQECYPTIHFELHSYDKTETAQIENILSELSKLGYIIKAISTQNSNFFENKCAESNVVFTDGRYRTVGYTAKLNDLSIDKMLTESVRAVTLGKVK
jgi:FkbM family methyltransferase